MASGSVLNVAFSNVTLSLWLQALYWIWHLHMLHSVYGFRFSTVDDILNCYPQPVASGSVLGMASSIVTLSLWFQTQYCRWHFELLPSVFGSRLYTECGIFKFYPQSMASGSVLGMAFQTATLSLWLQALYWIWHIQLLPSVYGFRLSTGDSIYKCCPQPVASSIKFTTMLEAIVETADHLHFK